MGMRDDFAVNTNDNAEWLRDRLNKLRSDSAAKIREIFQHAKLKERLNLQVDRSGYSRFLSKEQVKLSDADHHRIVNFIFEFGYWSENSNISSLNDIEDYLYHSVMKYMNIGVGTQESVAERLGGLYKIWRPSALRSNEYCLGLVRVHYKPGSHALTVEEKHRYSGRDGSRQMNEVYEGYVLRKDKKYFIVSRDDGARSLRVTILNGPRHDGKKVASISGASIGVEKARVCTVPVYLERFDGTRDELMDLLDIVPEDQVPDTVLQQLKDFEIKGLVVRF